MINRETYCKDCIRSIYAEHPDCDTNIENNRRYTRDTPCYCKCNENGMVEKYSWMKWNYFAKWKFFKN